MSHPDSIAGNRSRKTRRIRATAIAGAAALVGGILVANAHLVYVAVSTQPECLKPAAAGESAEAFRAAKPGC